MRVKYESFISLVSLVSLVAFLLIICIICWSWSSELSQFSKIWKVHQISFLSQVQALSMASIIFLEVSFIMLKDSQQRKDNLALAKWQNQIKYNQICLAHDLPGSITGYACVYDKIKFQVWPHKIWRQWSEVWLTSHQKCS